MLHLSPYIALEGVVGHNIDRYITSSTPVNSLVATIRIRILLKLFAVKNFHCFTSLPSFSKNLLYYMSCLNMSLKKFTKNLYSCTVILKTFSQWIYSIMDSADYGVNHYKFINQHVLIKVDRFYPLIFHSCSPLDFTRCPTVAISIYGRVQYSIKQLITHSFQCVFDQSSLTSDIVFVNQMQTSWMCYSFSQ